MSLSITKELESTLRLAFAEAKARRHENVTLEHLLYALLRDPVASRILRACGARMSELRRDAGAVERQGPDRRRQRPRRLLPRARLPRRLPARAAGHQPAGPLALHLP